MHDLFHFSATIYGASTHRVHVCCQLCTSIKTPFYPSIKWSTACQREAKEREEGTKTLIDQYYVYVTLFKEYFVNQNKNWQAADLKFTE